MRARNVDKLFSALLKDLFSIEAKTVIEVAGSEQKRLARIRAQRLAEEARLTEETARGVREEGAGKKKSAPQEAAYGRVIHDEPIPMNEITEDIGRMTVKGEVAALEMRDTKNGQSKIVTFSMTDHKGSVNCKLFLGTQRSTCSAAAARVRMAASRNRPKSCAPPSRTASGSRPRGNYRYDDYKREMVLMVSDVMSVPKPVREGQSPEKARGTAFAHADEYHGRLRLGQGADLAGRRLGAQRHRHHRTTAWCRPSRRPSARCAAKDIKFIPGCEGYLIEDAPEIVAGGDHRALEDAAFVVLDFETTGLNPNMDEIIEIGAVRLEHGREVGEFSQLIDPGRAIPEKVVELTGINAAMLAGQPTLAEVFPKFAKFLEGAVLVAHNASFDMAFLRRAFQRFGRELDAPILDTLALARNAYKELRNHKLGTVCKHLDVSLKNAHRAVHDARATGLVLLKTLERLNVARLDDINQAFQTDAGAQAYHIILLAKTRRA